MNIRRYLIIVLLSAIAIPIVNESAFAQEFGRIKMGKNCNYVGRIEVGKDVFLFKPQEDVEAAIDNIIEKMVIQPNFTVQAANVDNAAATITDNMLYILYNPEFKDVVTKKTRNDKAFISILAHEIGHHTQSHLQIDSKIPLQMSYLQIDILGLLCFA